MTSEVSSGQTVADVRQLLEQAQGLITQALRNLQAADTAHPGQVPYMDARTAARVEKLGEMAYRHKEFIDTHGSMTLAQSLAIRRAHYGGRVQSSANLFGTVGSGAILYRNSDYPSRVRYDHPICMTEEGIRIAELWRATHPD